MRNNWATRRIGLLTSGENMQRTLCGMVFAALVFPFIVTAQRITTPVTPQPPVISQASPARITVNMMNVSLEAALREVARQAGMGVSFTPSDVNLRTRVSVHLKR